MIFHAALLLRSLWIIQRWCKRKQQTKKKPENCSMFALELFSSILFGLAFYRVLFDLAHNLFSLHLVVVNVETSDFFFLLLFSVDKITTWMHNSPKWTEDIFIFRSNFKLNDSCLLHFGSADMLEKFPLHSAFDAVPTLINTQTEWNHTLFVDTNALR